MSQSLPPTMIRNLFRVAFFLLSAFNILMLYAVGYWIWNLNFVSACVPVVVVFIVYKINGFVGARAFPEANAKMLAEKAAKAAQRVDATKPAATL